MSQDPKMQGLRDGKYRAIRKLSGNGFGDQFLADDVLLPGNKVAIKVLRNQRECGKDSLFRENCLLA